MVADPTKLCSCELLRDRLQMLIIGTTREKADHTNTRLFQQPSSGSTCLVSLIGLAGLAGGFNNVAGRRRNLRKLVVRRGVTKWDQRTGFLQQQF